MSFLTVRVAYGLPPTRFNLPIDNVAKIKIIKGAASAPFGPNTMGGVINMVGRRPR